MRGKTTIIIISTTPAWSGVRPSWSFRTAAADERPTTGLQDTAGQNADRCHPVRAGRRPSRTRGSGVGEDEEPHTVSEIILRLKDEDLPQCAPRPAEGARPPRQRQDPGQGHPPAQRSEPATKKQETLMAMTSLEVARGAGYLRAAVARRSATVVAALDEDQAVARHRPGHRGRTVAVVDDVLVRSVLYRSDGSCTLRYQVRLAGRGDPARRRPIPGDRRRDPPVP